MQVATGKSKGNLELFMFFKMIVAQAIGSSSYLVDFILFYSFILKN